MTQINKYIFYISAVLNGILLIHLFGTIPFFLYLSVAINLGFLWYIKKMFDKNQSLEQDVVEMVDRIDSFSNHLEELHSLETYYGDTDLQEAIEHSRQLINDFIDFQQKYFEVEVILEPDQEEAAPTPQE